MGWLGESWIVVFMFFSRSERGKRQGGGKDTGKRVGGKGLKQ